MRLFLTAILICAEMYGCVCEPNIAIAFKTVETEVISNNLLVVNSNLATYNTAIQKNTEELKKQTLEYRELMNNEAVVAMELKKVLFELHKAVEAQSVKNRALSQDIQGVLKQNEGMVVIRQKLLQNSGK